MAERTTVSLIRCHDYEPQRLAKAVERQLRLLGGIERFIKPGDRVLLKPNFITPRSHRQDPTQTHPEVILAVKNMFGCVSGKRKAMCHYLYGGDPAKFCRLLIDICYFLRPAVTLIDGIVAMERRGPSGGVGRLLGWLIGGADPLSCETVCCRLLGIDPERVPLLRAAGNMQLDGLDLDRIELVGDSPGEPLSDFELPTLAPIRFSLCRVLRSKLRQMWLLARKPKLTSSP